MRYCTIRSKSGAIRTAILIAVSTLALTGCQAVRDIAGGITLRSPITVNYGASEFVACNDQGCTITIPQQQRYVPYKRQPVEK